MKFRLTFLDKTVFDKPEDWNKPFAYVFDGLEVPDEKLSIYDVTGRLRQTEEHLSRMTGLEVKIERVE